MKRLRPLSLLVLGVLTGCASDPIKSGYDALARGDCAAALRAWLPKAKEGDAAAQNNMGVLWAQGCAAAKLPQNPKQAYNWYTQAASRGFPLAYQNLAFVYQSGTGVEKDESKAIAHFCKPAWKTDQVLGVIGAQI